MRKMIAKTKSKDNVPEVKVETKHEKKAKAVDAEVVEVESVADKIEGFKAAMLQRYGDGALMCLKDGPSKVVPVISTGLLGLDEAIGIGGYPGRIIEVYGPESCVDGDTFLQYCVRHSDGRIVNHKGGTIRRLWERFHGESAVGNGRGKYLRPETVGAEFLVASINEDDRVFRNRIVDVVKTGEKECFELSTLGGSSIVATADHRFFTGGKYRRLGDLTPGDEVMIHNNTPFTCEPPQRKGKEARVDIYVKHHPVAGTKTITARTSRTEEVYEDYEYKRLARARAVVEAHINGLAFDEYVDRLNRGDLGGLTFLERDDHVHHRDEDETNDVIENLVVLCAREHSRLHAMERHNNLRFVAVADTISSIVPVGVRETFDLKMESPFNNYIADGFVTHNSGKTTLALMACAEVQRVGGSAVYVDAEHALDVNYAKHGLGVDVENMLICQPDYGEQGVDVVKSTLQLQQANPARPLVIVVDSVDALIPKKMLDGDFDQEAKGEEGEKAASQGGLGQHAQLMSRCCRSLTPFFKGANATVIFINQIRMKIGVRFGNPETTSGGNALKFYASVRLDIRNIGKYEEAGQTIGNKFRVKVVKNKVAPPFHEYEGVNIYGRGLQRSVDYITIMDQRNMIERKGGWSAIKGTEIKVQGLAPLREWVDANEDQVRKLLGLKRR